MSVVKSVTMSVVSDLEVCGQASDLKVCGQASDDKVCGQSSDQLYVTLYGQLLVMA